MEHPSRQRPPSNPFDNVRTSAQSDAVWFIPLVLLLLFLFTVVSYPQSRRQAPKRPAVPAKFREVTQSDGVHFQYFADHSSKKYLLETMGAGVALFDFDNDGRLDIFMLNGASI